MNGAVATIGDVGVTPDREDHGRRTGHGPRPVVGRDVLRVIAVPEASAVGSQAVYHAVAESLGAGDPDTVLLVTPVDPYVCIGFHQDASTELDLGACKRLGLPVLRREVGGGAVYLDRGQVFVHWVFHPDHLPRSLADRYALFVEPLVATYRELGVPAMYRPVNDIHVEGRKIGGTGAARLGDAEVVVGSIMFDFAHDTMAEVLRVASEKMRGKVAATLREYVTSLHRELGVLPDRGEVLASYLRHAGASLGRTMEAGTLSGLERATLADVERRLSDETWTFRHTRRPPTGVKIHEDISVREGLHKAAAGLVRLVVVVRSGTILDAQVFGDFTLLPQTSLPAIEAALCGVVADPVVVTSAVREVYRALDLDAPGLEPEDFGAAMTAAIG